jgi:hypothetical protein
MLCEGCGRVEARMRHRNVSKRLGFCPTCKNKSQRRLYDLRNAEKVKAARRKYYKSNRKVLLEKAKQCSPAKRANKAAYNKKYRENNARLYAYNREYAHKNRRRLSALAAKRRKLREAIDPVFKLSNRLRSMISNRIHAGGKGDKHTQDILGASFAAVRKYLILTAIRRYGEYIPAACYHIDHIVPCASATTVEALLELHHYTNLQYLTPADNLAKGSKLEYKFIDCGDNTDDGTGDQE